MAIIREAREDEYDAVADLLTIAYAEYGPSTEDPPKLLEAWREYREEIPAVRDRLSDAELIVAEDDRDLVATVTFYPPRDTPLPERWAPGYAAIRLLGVHPDARGTGLGKTLTEWSITRAMGLGATHMGLHTTPLMSVARAMYERMGFVRFPENDFPITDDFVVMAYHLPL